MQSHDTQITWEGAGFLSSVFKGNDCEHSSSSAVSNGNDFDRDTVECLGSCLGRGSFWGLDRTKPVTGLFKLVPAARESKQVPKVE